MEFSFLLVKISTTTRELLEAIMIFHIELREPISSDQMEQNLSKSIQHINQSPTGVCYNLKFFEIYIIELCSFSNLSVTSPTSQLILQPFRCFTYITAHSPNLPLLHLCHSSFSNSSFASPTSQALHLIYVASHPCCTY